MILAYKQLGTLSALYFMQKYDTYTEWHEKIKIRFWKKVIQLL